MQHFSSMRFTPHRTDVLKTSSRLFLQLIYLINFDIYQFTISQIAIEKNTRMTLRKVTVKINFTYCSSLSFLYDTRHLIDELKTAKAQIFKLFDPKSTVIEAQTERNKWTDTSDKREKKHREIRWK